jgi:predicted short-subunit dehydrogenase-like oxidoreductase (DUF2520 family)
LNGLRLNFVGCGRLGRVLGCLLAQQGVHIQDVHTRSLQSAQEAVAAMGVGQPQVDLAAMRPAQLWCFAVADGQIAPMAQAVADLHRPTSAYGTPPIALHFSGALSSQELAPLAQVGWHTTSCHPILSFARFDVALAQFAGTACALEGDGAGKQVVGDIMRAIGAECFPIEADHKLLYHAAAVFSANFLPVLQDTAQQLWTRSGLPPDILAKVWPKMLENVTQNVLTMGPAAALTGPAARGDTTLVAQQHQALEGWNPDAAQAYAALSRLSMAIAAKRR